MPFCTRIHRGAVEIYYICPICFWRVIVVLGGPSVYRVLVYLAPSWNLSMFRYKELYEGSYGDSWQEGGWNRPFVILKAWNSRRLVHGKEMVWASRWSVALGHIHNVGSRPPGCRSWSGGCNELDCGCCRMHDEAKMQIRCHRMFVGMLRTGFGLVNIDDPICASVLSGPEFSADGYR